VAQTKTAPKAASKTRNAKASAKPAAKKAPKTAPKAAVKSPKKPATAKPKAGADEVTVDRRRVAAERRTEEVAATQPVEAPKPKLERREKVNRRRQIDPTTCERDYSEDEVDFMNALDAYKRRSGRMFPTCSEVLEVIRDMGYVQLSPAEMAALKTNRGAQQEASIESAVEAEALEALAESDEMFGE
jgi:hypothetical protein